MREYLKHRQSYLFELIRLEAPPVDRKCTLCKFDSGIFRCRDCCRPHFYCTSCCLSAHAAEPFHRIQRFNGQYFERHDLNQLGLTIDIRSHAGECTSTSADSSSTNRAHFNPFDDDSDWTDDDETVFHTSSDVQESTSCRNLVIVTSTGIFKRSVRWCTCPNTPKPHIQLLHSRLFPSTRQKPSTAFTFEVLDHFRLDALECNTAAMNFMSKLTRMTNEVFPSTVPVCHVILLHFTRHTDK